MRLRFVKRRVRRYTGYRPVINAHEVTAFA